MFKNYLIVGLISFLILAVKGIEPFQRKTNELTNFGTLKGVEKCMVYSESDLIGLEAIKTSCVRSFERRQYLPDLATGKAGLRIKKEKVGWGGHLENKQPGTVTTWIQIAVLLFSEDGAKKEVFGETPIWIDPLSEAEFWVELPEFERTEFDDIKFCEHEDEEAHSCMAWYITDIKGLSI